MEEKILTGKKHGMAALFGILLLNALGIVGIVAGANMDENPVLIAGGIVVLVFATFLWAGLKVLRPQEALVLTLFGKYIGTLKGEGFYYVNPFCSSFNPAAKRS